MYNVKKEYVFDLHMWLFIAFAVLYSVLFKYGIDNAFEVCVGLLGGALVMEAIARLSYYLVRKQGNEAEDENKEETNENKLKMKQRKELVIEESCC